MNAHNKLSLPYAWNKACGEDEYGVWVDFEIHGVTQRMRKVEPGTFLMGSPEDEPGRFENEIQHGVELSQGFLMADTTCTQELWKAVMGNNPSDLKGPQRPVVNINHDDCLKFIEAVNSSINNLNLRLPTEAEWEYACRAGTNTPYWFGDTISSQHVNYNEGNLVVFWQETKDVKSLPCNGWGFYQMHGNVREWCSDWYGEYEKSKSLDPKGPASGEARILRGGSWFSRARGCRSATRFSRPPNTSEDNYGFRFVRDLSR